METMSKVIVNFSDSYRVVIDDLNHTLEQFHPKSETRKNEAWLPLGYYSTMKGVLKRVCTFNDLEKREYDAIEYADAVMQKLDDIIEERE